MPSFWHALLVASVPIINGLTWWSLTRPATWRLSLQSWANGFAFAISLYYTFLFIPLLLPGLFAIVFFGWGLLPWAPALALASTLVLRRRLKLATGCANKRLPGFWRGATFACVLLIAASAPVWLTRSAMQMALSDEESTQRRALRLLRTIGDEDLILRECYGRTPTAANMDMFTLILGMGNRITPEKARELYYRVTGRPFNSVPAPPVRTGRGAWGELANWSWDRDQGGDRVGARVTGLYLESSRIDAVIQPEAATAYTEWTMVFRNDSPRQAEARAQIILPAGSVVSRLTLWINDEEREAAFGTRSQVRTAYERVAIRQRRDPVLVTTCGPDRILVQCFPVPPDGKTMKVRIGITSPMVLLDETNALLTWPHFAERNFTIRDVFRHSVWVESQGEITSKNGALAAEQPKPGVFALRGELTDSALSAHNIRITRDAGVREVWARDTFSSPTTVVCQKLVEVPTTPPQRVVLVIDASTGMEHVYPSVANCVRKMPEGIEIEVFIAGDTVTAVRPANIKTEADFRAKLAECISNIRAVGGQDNLPALEQAWDAAAEKTNSVVLWIHGPQPILLSSIEPLRQRYQRRAPGPVLLALQTESGPNRILEQLSDISSVKSVALFTSLPETLDRLLRSWQPNSRILVAQRTKVAEFPASATTNATSHIVRLWACDEVGRLISQRKTKEAAELAMLYQLVTRVTGAVVLETADQYKAHGLQPVDPATVPSIPEPSTYVLLGLGLAVLLANKRLRRAIAL
ncbi:MAG: PEP-CTERM sorting domain-containing protein [Verrucomicrobia bacterium]|nr:PEP-CTERM sorting domain-containing protein [Verrucomicrobiota bacterium]